MQLAELHPAWTIRADGDGFLIAHWNHCMRPIGCLVRTSARRWEMMLLGEEFSFSTTKQVIRYLNSRAHTR